MSCAVTFPVIEGQSAQKHSSDNQNHQYLTVSLLGHQISKDTPEEPGPEVCCGLFWQRKEFHRQRGRPGWL